MCDQIFQAGAKFVLFSRGWNSHSTGLFETGLSGSLHRADARQCEAFSSFGGLNLNMIRVIWFESPLLGIHTVCRMVQRMTSRACFQNSAQATHCPGIVGAKITDVLDCVDTHVF